MAPAVPELLARAEEQLSADMVAAGGEGSGLFVFLQARDSRAKEKTRR
jgi:hypothetical protein